MNTPRARLRWVFAEDRAHVLADGVEVTSVFVTRCGRTIPASQPRNSWEVGPPVFPTLGGQAPASTCTAPEPGGRS